MRLLCALALVVLIAVPAAAAEPEDVANDMSQRIMSPYCEGVTLHDCPSAQALELRDQIEEWAASGMSEHAIEDRLVAEFGPQIVATPPASGFNLLAWLLPVVALSSGGGLALWAARRWRTDVPAERPAIDDEGRRRVASELRSYRDQT